MTLIDNLTDQANQVTQVVLEDGSLLVLNLLYSAASQNWIFNMAHPSLTMNGLRLCVHPNLLREWRNVIAFGLACSTVSGIDPLSVEDFTNGNATLYALTAADVQLVEANVFGGVLQ